MKSVFLILWVGAIIVADFLRNRYLRVPAGWRGRPVGVFTAVEVELEKR